MTATSASDAIAAAMSETDLERAVARNARQLGLLAYHTRDSRRSPEGFPDWVLCGANGVIFRELKRQSGKPTQAQQAWLDGLAAAGMDVGLWRPCDLLGGRVAREMAALGKHSPRHAGSRLSGVRLTAKGDHHER